MKKDNVDNFSVVTSVVIATILLIYALIQLL